MHGQVRAITTKQPIPMIKVSVYRDLVLLEHTFTDTEGRYDLAIPAGDMVTVRFDTHETLNNAHAWHPSVVANAVAGDTVPFDRCLLPTGHAAAEDSAVDALSGYLFAAALWSDSEQNAAYAHAAASRLSSLKLTSRALQEIQQRLVDHFQAPSQ
ncbi:carboxypeptidase regulatory-like domain-containing protein [Streptomyces sp. uw30]|uniref:carboxypeptidase regulatory-like domain-containing protein n=1 Tax=Streptomyces sp. uw30 TaxID=1828179 RepID=UPI0011CD50C8|nr:carboxypeptidase regulatory-like domain-containing protein [Streptomyces sp. uw30]TXS52101.1 carboxypeptidase regulatory-like domain-containing protein [Streptomyces sp. uw30]